MSEIWLPVVGFEDTYSVSSFGRVRRDIRGPGTQAGRILKPHVTQKGYHSVCLSRDLKGHTIFVHVVVAEAFIGPRPEGQEINHKDADKQHNVPSNLEWTTHLLNIRHSEALGLRTPRRGETHHSARYSDATIAAVRASSLSSKRASEVFGISSGYIKMLRRGEFRVHGPAEAFAVSLTIDLMRLYRVQFDGEHYFVEAESMPTAIALWKLWAAKEWSEDWEGTEEPESCEYINAGSVIRAVPS